MEKKFELIHHAIDAGIAKVQKWLTKIHKSGVAFICLGKCLPNSVHLVLTTSSALHPKYKFEYAKNKLSKKDFKAGMKKFEAVVH